MAASFLRDSSVARPGLSFIVLMVTCHLATPSPPGPVSSSPGEMLPEGAILRVGSLRWRATGPITMTAFAAGGKEVLTGGTDRMITRWDATTGKELGRLEAETGGTEPGMLTAGNGLRPLVSGDGRTLVTVGRARILNVWDLEKGKIRRKLGATTGNQIAVSRDGKWVAVAEPTGEIRYWDTTSEKPTQFLRTSADGGRTYFYRLEFSGDGTTLMQLGLNYPGNGGVQPAIVVYDLASGKEVKRLTELPDGSPPNSVLRAFGSADHKLLYIPLASSVAVVDLETGKERMRLKDVDQSQTSTFLLAANGAELIQLIDRAQIVVWDLAKGTIARRFGESMAEPARQAVNMLAASVSPDASTLAIGNGALLSLIDLKNGESRGGVDLGHTTPLLGAHYSPDGKTILTRSDRTYIRWDAATGEYMERYDVPEIHSNFLLTRDAKWMVATSTNLSLSIYDTATKKEQRVIATGAQGGYTYSVLPDSKTLVVLGRPASHIVMYDITTGNKTGELTLPPYDPSRENDAGSLPRRITTSRDARFLAGCTENAVIVWDLFWKREVQRIDIPTNRVLRHIAFGADGRTIAIEFYGGEVGVWEVASGSRRRLLREVDKIDRTYTDSGMRVALDGSRLPAALAVSPDGRLIAAAGVDRNVRIWDARSGRELSVLSGHRGPITGVGFSPDSKRLVTACTDTTSLVWNLVPMRENLAAPSGAKLEGAWDALAKPDGDQAFDAILALAADPVKGVAVLREQLKAVAAPEENSMARLIADLSAAKFSTRVKARQDLEKLGELAQPALREAMETTSSAEVRTQARRLLELLSQRRLTPEQMRHVRAIEALELAATPEARAVLTTLAKGAPAAPLTSEANAALERLAEK